MLISKGDVAQRLKAFCEAEPNLTGWTLGFQIRNPQMKLYFLPMLLSLVAVQLLRVLPAEVPEDDPADLHALPGISHSAERGSGRQSGPAGSAPLKRFWGREQNHAGPGPADPPPPGYGLKSISFFFTERWKTVF